MFRLPEKDLIDDLRDHEFGHAYLEDQANLRIAAQVKVLRQQRGWTQEELAARSDMKQTRISKIEGADFESVTLTTLRKLSQAFDVHLSVKFEEVADALIDLSNLSRKRLQAKSRERSLTRFDSVGGIEAIAMSSPPLVTGVQVSLTGVSASSCEKNATFASGF